MLVDNDTHNLNIIYQLLLTTNIILCVICLLLIILVITLINKPEKTVSKDVTKNLRFKR